MTNDDKPTMSYRVCRGHDVRTGGTVLRPVVTGRRTLDLSQIVEYAREAGFVRGHQKDLEGMLEGFVEAMRDRARAGFSVNVNDWFVISGQLKGTLGDDGRLTRANKYEINIKASKNLKVDADTFRWTREDDPHKPFKPVKKAKVNEVCAYDGRRDAVVAGHNFAVSGRNLSYHPEWGDKIEVSWPVAQQADGAAPQTDGEVPQTAGETVKTVEIVPDSWVPEVLFFDWPEAFDEIPSGTPLTFTFRMRGAADAVNTQTLTATARMVDASGEAG
ncbi:MAG: hypothetical protein ACI4RA_04090 [Kiritimatiellia bacterium]